MDFLKVNFQSFIDFISVKQDVLLDFGLKLVVALLVLWVGLKVVGFICRIASDRILKSNIDPTLRPFIVNLISWTLKIMLFISVAGMLGIQTTSFVAILGAAGLAVGLALQGSLSNFAGGALLLIFRPFKVGDLVEISGQTGHVTEIQIFNTLLKTATNKVIILPNGAVAGGTIVNFSTLGNMRVDLEVVLSEESDLNKARQLFEQAMHKHPMVLTEPAPEVKMMKFEGGDMRINVMPWAHPDNYWTVYYDLHEAIRNIIAETANINYPTPNIKVISQ
jgi:small conductance mechanosensitive channel